MSRSLSRELSDLQYPTPGHEGTKQRLKSIHRFGKSPDKDVSYHKENGFVVVNRPDRFRDVRQARRCLRCYNQNHRAGNCTIYTYPTVDVCRYCHWLYHPAQKCIYYTSDGKSRPGSPSNFQKN
jgi:hypothetical protein